MQMMEDRTNSQFKKDISPLGIWALSIGTSIGWGSLVVTANTYLAKAGPLGSTIGLFVAILVMLFISRNYSYMIECYPDNGGAYTYVREALGYDFGFLSAWFLALTYLAVLWANATSLPLFARYFIGDIFRFGKLFTLFGYDIYLGEALLSVAAIALFSWLCGYLRKLSIVLVTVMSVVFTCGIIAVAIPSLFGSSGIEPFFDRNSGAFRFRRE